MSPEPLIPFDGEVELLMEVRKTDGSVEYRKVTSDAEEVITEAEYREATS